MFAEIFDCSLIIMYDSYRVSQVKQVSTYANHALSINRHIQLRFVNIDFMSGDRFLDKTSFEYFKVFHSMITYAMNEKCGVIPKPHKGMVTWLEMGKANLAPIMFIVTSIE